MRMTTWTVGALGATFALGLSAAIAQQGANESAFDNSTWCDKGRSTWTRDGATWHRTCEIRTLTFEPEGRTLRVDGSRNGGVAVRAGADGSITLHVRVTAGAPELEHAEDIASRVEIERRDGVFVSSGPELDDEAGWWSASFRVEAPRYSDVELKTFNGGISIHGIEGELRATTMNGGISVEECVGPLSAETVNGGITLERTVGSMQAVSTNGGIQIRLDEAPDAAHAYSFETANGGVEIDMPAGDGASLNLATHIGPISVEVGAESKSQIGGTIRTDIGEGGPAIVALTTHGAIHVRLRED